MTELVPYAFGGAWHLESVFRIAGDLSTTSQGAVIRATMVGFAYFLWNVSYFVMMVQGYRHKTYGMPAIGAAAVLAICMITLYGPFSNQSHLFFYRENYAMLAVWTICLLMQGGVFVQCLVYGGTHRHLIPEMAPHFRLVVVAMLVTLVITFWTFIVYYQDYYVNEICPVAVLIVAAGFLGTLRERPDLKGLSVTVAWCLTVGNILNYSAVVLGDMTDPYPDASFGYGFIYWIYFLTIVLNLTYATSITRRYRDLRAGAPLPAPATA